MKSLYLRVKILLTVLSSKCGKTLVLWVKFPEKLCSIIIEMKAFNLI